jgi:hypothetical protein
MGSGTWDRASYRAFAARSSKVLDDSGRIKGDYDAQTMFASRHLDPLLNIYNKTRECCDSEEHPNTIPVIIGLDVTGSMGGAAVEVAKSLNPIMTKLYSEIADVQFAVMGIGDLSYDEAPLQMSQFESDIRIAEQLDKIYFEGMGGGNNFESYTEAWWVGINCCSLDCWKRGRKGIIITLGDELMNPYLPGRRLNTVTGKPVQGDVETEALYEEASKKFDIHHIAVNSPMCSYNGYADGIKNSFGKLLGEHLHIATMDELEDMIVNIVKDSVRGCGVLMDDSQSTDDGSETATPAAPITPGFISW